MHKLKTYALAALSILLFQSHAHAAFVSGSTGADGALNISGGTITVPASGVLNYTTVNIASNVSFTPNTTNSPVVILATGDVTISGNVSINGSNANSILPGSGGPGGFNGGYAGATGVAGGRGQGPGGGSGTATGNAGSGSYATAQASCSLCGSTYGNAYIIPLVGGSGGGGQTVSNHGGGGGGALIIASSGTITVTGSITANGGSGYYSSGYSGGSGSGGAIRLIANTITGNGTISATGLNGNNGYIRLETTNNNRAALTTPMYTLGAPSSVFGANLPTLTVSSIGGTATPSSPTGRYSQPDVLLPYGTTNPVTIGISATNIPVGTTIKVRVIPQSGSDSSVNTTLSGTTAASSGSASVTIPTSSTSVISAEATFTVIAMSYEGEEINQIRVATSAGGGSEVYYIAKSGKEFKVS